MTSGAKVIYIRHRSYLRGFLQPVRWADMTPPPGTTASIPEWLLSELAGFLKRGEETNAEPFDEDRDRMLSALNPGYLLLSMILSPFRSADLYWLSRYGGRASPSKGRRARERVRAPATAPAA